MLIVKHIAAPGQRTQAPRASAAATGRSQIRISEAERTEPCVAAGCGAESAEAPQADDGPSEKRQFVPDPGGDEFT
jgi:hypothetical protein